MKLIPALAGVLALACATLAHAATVAVPASSVHLCVNVHDQDASQVVSAMKAAGFGCYRKDATGAPLESALAAAGFKGDFIVTDGPGPAQQMAKVSALAHAYPGAVESVESRNEVNNRATVYGGFTDTTGGDQSKRQAIGLYDAALEATVNGLLPGVPVLAHTDIHASYGPTDWANAHAYDGDTDSWPDYWPAQVAKEMAAAMPGKPQALTEFGVKHADREPYLLPQWIATSLQAGIDRVWLYELRDAPGDAYGLYNADWKPKPAVAVLAKLNRLLADTGQGGAAKPLGVIVSDPAVNSVLIAKGDGSYVHLLWRSWPDGKVHPFTWSYDRAMHVTARILPTPASTGLFDFGWSKRAGQPSDWMSYSGGVLVLEVRP